MRICIVQSQTTSFKEAGAQEKERHPYYYDTAAKIVKFARA